MKSSEWIELSKLVWQRTSQDEADRDPTTWVKTEKKLGKEYEFVDGQKHRDFIEKHEMPEAEAFAITNSRLTHLGVSMNNKRWTAYWYEFGKQRFVSCRSRAVAEYLAFRLRLLGVAQCDNRVAHDLPQT